MNQPELDLLEIFWVLRRRLWLILIVPVLAAVTAGIVSVFVLDPVYSASTTLWVIKEGSSKIEYTDLLASRNLTKTYAEVAKSRSVMADVIDDLKLTNTTMQQLQDKLTVIPVRDTEILSFTVLDGDPIMAAKLADSMARSFMGQIRSYMRVENVKVVDPALIPTNPVKPSRTLNVAIAFVLGLMAAVGVSFLLEYLDTTLKSPDDVSRHLGLPVLGLIPIIEPHGVEVSNRRSKARASRLSTAVNK